MLNPKTYHIQLDSEEYTIYSKHLILEQIGIEGQKRLKKAKVLIVGAGGLGCPIMIYLTSSGVGYLGIIDKDTIEASNLSRQILYTQKNINCSKVVSAKQKLKDINNKCKIITHKYELNEKNSLEIISYYDIIIDATDNFQTRYIIDKTCHKLHKIHIYGSINQFEGQVSIFHYKNGIRYTNLYSKSLNLSDHNCSNSGIMGITSGYIGILQAIETIKIIIGIKQNLDNSILLCNLINSKKIIKKIYISNQQKTLAKNIEKDKIPHQLLKTWALKTKKNIIIVDIREINEFNKRHIKQAINIPLKKLKLSRTIKFIQKYSTRKALIIYCNTNSRSIIASSLLKVYNITHYITH
uniref:Molybdopterin biosynthesis protein n=1 Tax=Alsidium seaforthii TaxID=2007182 RepID=A0A1Z1MDI8_9FLOR|nr:Molybdopterin biosynthesis protein [Bryothamnion seaforthii]ARW64026.1 Molybdopterin biosynthesis protein [Bryothamnion seaforthii]